MLERGRRNGINFYENSLDFICLIAALDVMIAHTSVYVLGNGSGNNILFWRVIAPGSAVVVFFSISGFLTMASFEHSESITKFYIKRAARIYPALLIAIILPVIIYAISDLIVVEPKGFLKYILKKSITGRGGGYNPDGAIGNGSLWTIFIQIQFYILTPILHFIIKKIKKQYHVLIIFVLILFNLFTPQMRDFLPSVLFRLYQNNCIPYLYMYVLGVILYLDREIIIPILTRRNVLICLSGVYILWHWILGADFLLEWTYINPVSAVIIVLICLGMGYALGTHRVKVDFSYGLFLWHLPIMDILHTVIEMRYSIVMLIMTWIISITVAILSNVLIEKPVVKITRKLVS